MKRKETGRKPFAGLTVVCPPGRPQLESVGMKTNPPRLDWGLKREILVVAALTLIGGVLRLWSIGRIGLEHFDEGIYATSGLWIFSPGGFSDLGQSVIAYAPPGFPFLVGLSYLLLGVSDLSATLVSIACGTLTIPAVAWLARRTFGSGAGGVAAAFAALSGAHVAFSRMALTDASFLLFWVLALVQGQRFLERPNAGRALVLGLAVGVSQLFKYNGWLAGVVVILSAAIWLAAHPRQWRSGHTAATWGFGLAAALIAAATYWPWFAFVDAHGGYHALLTHQRGYLGGVTAWPMNLKAQLDQARALSGGSVWLASGGLTAALAMTLIAGELVSVRQLRPRMLLEILSLTAVCLVPNLAWWVPLICLPGLVGWARVADSRTVTVLGTAWVILSLLTPFYHPYARLWLPVESLGWLIIAGVFVGARSRIEIARGASARNLNRLSDPLTWFAFLGVAGLVFSALAANRSANSRLPGVLAPSNSIRNAVASLTRDLPEDVHRLRVLARPPVTFYLGQSRRVTVERQPSLSRLLEPADATSWAVLDMAIIRQDKALEVDLVPQAARWTLVRAIPTRLSLPVLLDIDPGAAGGANANPEVELRLLRPKRAGDPK